MDHTLFTTPVDRPTAEMPVIIPAIPSQRQIVDDVPPVAPAVSPDPVVTTAPVSPHPLAGKHALVVGINYAPEPSGNAPYTTGMAEHLARHAAGVTVLTGVPHYPNWSVDRSHRWMVRSSETVPVDEGAGLTVRRARHYVPGRQNAITRAGYEGSFLINTVSTRVENRPDLVVAVTPTLSGAVAGLRLARRHGSKLLVVVQELSAKAAQQSGIRGGEYAARATAAIERYALTRADRVAIVSEAFRQQMHEYGIADEKISLLPNWTHISPTRLTQAEARLDLGWDPDPFTVVYTGNIGLKQDLGNLVEAARLCERTPDLRFVIVGNGSQRAAVEAQAAGLSNLRFVDSLSAEDYPKSLAAADLLVVNERTGVQEMSLPSKLTSYLTAGRPVIAAIEEDGATAHELGRTRGAGAIVPAGDPAAFVEAVLNLRLDPTRRARMSTAGTVYAHSMLGTRSANARLDAVIARCLSQS